jgi:uncharacterized protein YhfF
VSGLEGNRHTAATDAYFARFLAETGVRADRYDTVAFGSDEVTQDELADLVLHGPKRATTSALRDYRPGSAEGERVPQAGDHCVIVDGRGTPVAVYRSTRVDIARFGDVDEAFAWDEGEGDRSLADWRDGHIRYFTLSAAEEGWVFDEDTEVVLERFTVVWPPEVADPA